MYIIYIYTYIYSTYVILIHSMSLYVISCALVTNTNWSCESVDIGYCALLAGYSD